MKWHYFFTGLAMVLVFILAYTTAAKLFNLSHYTRAMFAQPLPAWVTHMVVYLVPAAEICAISLIVAPYTRVKGLWFATGLFAVFALYTTWIFATGQNKTTCPCGGLFSFLNWRNHLLVNCTLTLMAAIAAIGHQYQPNIFHGHEKRGNADAPDQTK